MTTISRAALLDALQALADALNTTPTRAQMDAHGRYSHRPYYTAFDSWNAALRAVEVALHHGTDELQNSGWSGLPAPRW